MHHELKCDGGLAVPPDIMSEQANKTAADRWKAAEGLMNRAEWGSSADGSGNGFPVVITSCMMRRAWDARAKEQEACHARWRLSGGELLLLLLLLLRQHRRLRWWGAGKRWWPREADALSAWMQPCRPPTLLPHVDAAARPHLMAAAAWSVMMHISECCDKSNDTAPQTLLPTCARLRWQPAAAAARAAAPMAKLLACESEQ